MPDYKFIETARDGDVAVAIVNDPDLQQRLIVCELGDELNDYVDRQKPQKLLVSFERVTICSSEVIGGLIRTQRRMTERGGELKLCSMLASIREIFQLTGLDGSIFDIHDTVEDAMAAF